MDRLTLYTDAFSPGSDMVRFAVAELGIDVDQRVVDCGPAQKNLDPDYFSLTHSGYLPLLIHGNETVKGEFAVIKYLSRQLPGTELAPKADWQQSLCFKWLELAEHFPLGAFMLAFARGSRARLARDSIKAGIRKCRRQQKRSEDLSESYCQWQQRLERQRLWVALSPSSEPVASLGREIHSLMGRLDAHLAKREWIADQFSMADIAWGAILASLNRVSKQFLIEGQDHVHLLGYFKRLQKRTGFRKANIARQGLGAAALPMLIRGYWRRLLFIAVAVIAVLITLLLPMSVAASSSDQRGDNYQKVLQDIQVQYQDVQLSVNQLEEMGLYLRTRAGAPLRIHQVAPGSTADQQGLRSGDQVVSINGATISDRYDLEAVLHSVGKQLSNVRGQAEFQLITLRDGARSKHVLHRVAPASRRYSTHKSPKVPESVKRQQDHDRAMAEVQEAVPVEGLFIREGNTELFLSDSHGSVGRWGAVHLAVLDSEMEPYFGVTSGVLVLKNGDVSFPLLAGDVVVSVNGRPVAEPLTLIRVMDDNRSFRLVVMRQGQEMTLNNP